MTKCRVTVAIMRGICALVFAVAATPARAGTAYVSSTGTNFVDCTLAAPCPFIYLAIPAAGPNGEVICLDKGNYGPPAGTGVTISAPITISCGDGLWEAAGGFVLVSGQAGSDVVIEGLVMDQIGFEFTGQGTLHLRRVRFGDGLNENGLTFIPTGPATLHITDSVFYKNDVSGVLIQPQPGGSANVHIRNSKFEHNAHGIFVDGTNGVVNVNMAKSAAVDNKGSGIGARSTSGSAVTISVTTSQIGGNLTDGISSVATGAGTVAVKIGNSQITGNVNGLNAGGSGQILTLGGNQLHSNLSNGSFTGSIPTQ